MGRSAGPQPWITSTRRFQARHSTSRRPTPTGTPLQWARGGRAARSSTRLGLKWAGEPRATSARLAAKRGAQGVRPGVASSTCVGAVSPGTNIRGDGARAHTSGVAVPASSRRGVAYGMVSLRCRKRFAHPPQGPAAAAAALAPAKPGPDLSHGCRRRARDWRPHLCASRGMGGGNWPRFVAQFARELAGA